ncbi:hypothetical protein [Shimia sp.]|uniref:hypothetical protein n=1 Tax=Shimia sp. TaxID=1954381 RepID=UPI003B8C6E6D
MANSSVLTSVSIYGASIIAGFAVLFFVFCGIFVLLHIAGIRTLPEDTRKQLFAVFLVSTLASTAGVVALVFNENTLSPLLEQLDVAEKQRNSAVAALEDTSRVTEAAGTAVPGSPFSDQRSVVFLHVVGDSRKAEASRMGNELTAQGVIVPGIENVSIAVSSDQVRYFHKSAKQTAEQIAQEVGIASDGVRFVNGFQQRVGPEHFEIWLKP